MLTYDDEKHGAYKVMVMNICECGCGRDAGKNRFINNHHRRGAHRVPFEDKIVPIPESGCMIWMGMCNKAGYGLFYTRGKYMLAHRLSWEINYGEIPKGICVCHKCDTPLCVNPHHLFLGTHRDNTLDRCIKGRSAVGEKHGKSKITKDQAIEILNSKDSASSISKRMKISLSVVYQIRSKTAWRHIQNA